MEMREAETGCGGGGCVGAHRHGCFLLSDMSHQSKRLIRKYLKFYYGLLFTLLTYNKKI